MKNGGYQFGFEKLNVWQEARGMANMIYSLTIHFPGEEKFVLVSQMRRAALSVCSNIAEGSSRKSHKDQAHFYNLSYSSLMELLNQCIIAKDQILIKEEQLNECREKISKTANMLNALRNNCLKQSNNKPPTKQHPTNK